MIRIGFDPMLEVELQHRELIKQVEQYRLAREALGSAQVRVSTGSRILALLGKGMSSLGASLESRYANNPDVQVNLNAQSNIGGCTS